MSNIHYKANGNGKNGVLTQWHRKMAPLES